MKEYSVVLVGVGGYGTSFLRRLLQEDCDLPMVGYEHFAGK